MRIIVQHSQLYYCTNVMINKYTNTWQIHRFGNNGLLAIRKTCLCKHGLQSSTNICYIPLESTSLHSVQVLLPQLHVDDKSQGNIPLPLQISAFSELQAMRKMREECLYVIDWWRSIVKSMHTKVQWKIEGISAEGTYGVIPVETIDHRLLITCSRA